MSNQNKTVDGDLQLQIIRAKQLLRMHGYYVDYIFHVEDVKCLTDKTITDEQAFTILEEYFEFYMCEINHRLEELVENLDDEQDEN